ncbi:DUF998 domain-containing protein [Candidatus Woesearchaeota archaeon]|nr:DUF998 domain-containing protein [Candidatus Woesearchaeota archaeon]
MHLFDKFLNTSGLISIFFVTLTFIFCWKKNNFNLKKHTLSCCGSHNYSKLFNFSLAVFGILQILFTYAIIKKVLSGTDGWLIIPPIIAGTAMILAAIFDNKKHFKIHLFSACVTFITLILWCFMFHFFIMKNSFYIGIIALNISVLLSLGTIITYIKFGKCAVPEIFFIGSVFLWNLFFSYVIILL